MITGAATNKMHNQQASKTPTKKACAHVARNPPFHPLCLFICTSLLSAHSGNFSTTKSIHIVANSKNCFRAFCTKTLIVVSEGCIFFSHVERTSGQLRVLSAREDRESRWFAPYARQYRQPHENHRYANVRHDQGIERVGRRGSHLVMTRGKKNRS